MTDTDDMVDYYSPFYDSSDLSNDSIDDVLDADNDININDLFDSDMEWDDDNTDVIGEYLADTTVGEIAACDKFTGYRSGQPGRYVLFVDCGRYDKTRRHRVAINVVIRARSGVYTAVINGICDLNDLLKLAPRLLKYSDVNTIYGQLFDIIYRDV
ncbi:hypothetical protein F-E9_125 [Faustovirus]|nr:hypothetical protein F-E9_125 [Faustovirus]